MEKKEIIIIIAIIFIIGFIVLGVQIYNNQLIRFYEQGQIDIYKDKYGFGEGCAHYPNITIQLNSTSIINVTLVNCFVE